MRNFKIKKRAKPIFVSKTAFVNVTLLTGIVLFIGLASLTGKLVSNQIVPGDQVVMKPSVSPGSTGDTDEGYTNITLEPQDYYFVQFGMFTSSDNAKLCADAIAKLGGAGYVREVEGKHYVFAMSYSQNEDAKTVVADLKAQGYSTMLKCYSHNGLSINLSGSKENTDRIKSAMNGIAQLPQSVEMLIYSFDEGQCTREELLLDIDKVCNTVNESKAVLAEYSEQSIVFQKGAEYCDAVAKELGELKNTEDETVFKSSLKFIYINSIFNLIEYLDNVLI